jgi:hypothetical protein
MEWQTISRWDFVDASEDDTGTVVVRNTTPKPRASTQLQYSALRIGDGNESLGKLQVIGAKYFEMSISDC